MRESRILKRDVNGEMDAGEGREMCGEGRGLLEERGGRNSTGGNGTEERGRRGKMKGLGKAQT